MSEYLVDLHVYKRKVLKNVKDKVTTLPKTCYNIFIKVDYFILLPYRNFTMFKTEGIVLFLTFVKLTFKISHCINVKIAAILPEDESRLFSYKRISPAIEYAIQYLHNHTDYVTEHTFSVEYRDSNCSSADPMNHAINFYMEKNVHVFFGPVCDFSVAPVARQVKFWNLPLITAGAMARDFDNYRNEEYNLLSRVGPVNFKSLAIMIMHILEKNRWNTFKLIYDNEGQSEYINAFCVLAAGSLHYEIKARNPNISQDHFNINRVKDIDAMLNAEVGLKYGGK